MDVNLSSFFHYRRLPNEIIPRFARGRQQAPAVGGPPEQREDQGGVPRELRSAEVQLAVLPGYGHWLGLVRHLCIGLYIRAKVRPWRRTIG